MLMCGVRRTLIALISKVLKCDKNPLMDIKETKSDTHAEGH